MYTKMMEKTIKKEKTKNKQRKTRKTTFVSTVNDRKRENPANQNQNTAYYHAV